MELWEAITSRRSCRSFKPSPVREAQINRLISACQWAPSPLHLQPWEFVIITETDTKAKIRQVAEDARQAVMAADGPAWVAKYDLTFVEKAPLLICVLYNPAKSGLGSYFSQQGGAMMAASAGVQNMLLTAAEMALGSLWLTFFDPGRMKEVLNIPEKLDIAGLIVLGNPTEWPSAPPRKSPKVFHESYGGAE